MQPSLAQAWLLLAPAASAFSSGAIIVTQIFSYEDACWGDIRQVLLRRWGFFGLACASGGLSGFLAGLAVLLLASDRKAFITATHGWVALMWLSIGITGSLAPRLIALAFRAAMRKVAHTEGEDQTRGPSQRIDSVIFQLGAQKVLDEWCLFRSAPRKVARLAALRDLHALAVSDVEAARGLSGEVYEYANRRGLVPSIYVMQLLENLRPDADGLSNDSVVSSVDALGFELWSTGWVFPVQAVLSAERPAS